MKISKILNDIIKQPWRPNEAYNSIIFESEYMYFIKDFKPINLYKDSLQDNIEIVAIKLSKDRNNDISKETFDSDKTEIIYTSEDIRVPTGDFKIKKRMLATKRLSFTHQIILIDDEEEFKSIQTEILKVCIKEGISWIYVENIIFKVKILDRFEYIRCDLTKVAEGNGEGKLKREKKKEICFSFFSWESKIICVDERKEYSKKIDHIINDVLNGKKLFNNRCKRKKNTKNIKRSDPICILEY